MHAKTYFDHYSCFVHHIFPKKGLIASDVTIKRSLSQRNLINHTHLFIPIDKYRVIGQKFPILSSAWYLLFRKYFLDIFKSNLIILTWFHFSEYASYTQELYWAVESESSDDARNLRRCFIATYKLTSPDASDYSYFYHPPTSECTCTSVITTFRYAVYHKFRSLPLKSAVVLAGPFYPVKVSAIIL